MRRRCLVDRRQLYFKTNLRCLLCCHWHFANPCWICQGVEWDPASKSFYCKSHLSSSISSPRLPGSSSSVNISIPIITLLPTFNAIDLIDLLFPRVLQSVSSSSPTLLPLICTTLELLKLNPRLRQFQHPLSDASSTKIYHHHYHHHHHRNHCVTQCDSVRHCVEVCDTVWDTV